MLLINISRCYRPISTKISPTLNFFCLWRSIFLKMHPQHFFLSYSTFFVSMGDNNTAVCYFNVVECVGHQSQQSSSQFFPIFQSCLKMLFERVPITVPQMWKLRKNQWKSNSCVHKMALFGSCFQRKEVQENGFKWVFEFHVSHWGISPGWGACSCPSAPDHKSSSTALFLPWFPALCYLPGSWLWLDNMASSLSSFASLLIVLLLSLGKSFMSSVFPRGLKFLIKWSSLVQHLADFRLTWSFLWHFTGWCRYKQRQLQRG